MENRALARQWLGSTIWALIISRKVLYMPPLKDKPTDEEAMRLSGERREARGEDVDILMLAPKEALPLVEVPTPRWTLSEVMLLAMSVMLTQKTVWLSLSLSGTSLRVMLIRV